MEIKSKSKIWKYIRKERGGHLKFSKDIQTRESFLRILIGTNTMTPEKEQEEE